MTLREAEELSKVDSRDLVLVTLTAQLTRFTSGWALFWDVSWVSFFCLESKASDDLPF